jgi:autotransporter-associated beta strand protein
LLALQVAALAGAANVWAGVSFDPTVSTLTITHDADINNPNDTLFTKRPSIVPPSGNLYPVNNYQMNHTFTVTGTNDSGEAIESSTLATGSLGHVTNATTASFIMATGTGVIQDDPGDQLIHGASSLKFNLDLRWDVTTGNFGPIANGYASLAVGGVVGDLGSATVKVHLLFRNQSGTELRTAYDDERTYGPGPFTDILTTSRVLGSGTLPAGSKLRVSGTVEFLSSNEGGPTTIHPIRAEMGGAPPTAHFKIDQDGSYFDNNNWQSVPEGEDGLRLLANAAGERAVFIGTDQKTPHSVSIGSGLTLGTLEIDGNSPYSFTNGDAGRIQFVSSSGAPNRLNVRGNGFGHALLVPVDVDQDLEISTDQNTSIGFADHINGVGNIRKLGGGAATLGQSNANFAGDISVLDGSLRGNAFRALGVGHVVVDGGQVDYDVAGASGNPVQVKRGLINVNARGEGDSFSVQQGGAIGGNPNAVNALHVGQDLLLSSGAMIVHGDPVNVQNGNPQGLGNDPLYIFGIAGALPVGEMAIGTASGTPWVGIGGSRGFSEFGTPEGLITVQGSAVLASLPGGSIDVKSRIGGAGGGLTKMGDGSVRLLNSNPFDGQTSVNEGALIVNGSLGGDVTVRSGGALGGQGQLIGLLRGENGGAVAPGDGGVGTLTVGTLQLADQANLNFDLDSPSSSDKILIAGDLVLDGQLFIEAGDNFGPGKYPIMHFNGALTDNGLKIASAPEGFIFDVVVEPDIILRAAGKNGANGVPQTVFLVVVPEPASLSIMGAATLGLLIRRKRR